MRTMTTKTMTTTMAHPANAPGRRDSPVCVVTGATSGIGFATALALSRRASRLGLVCRDEEKGRFARARIRALNPSCGPIELWIADLASLESVRVAARAIDAEYDRIDVLVNNAGAVFSKRALSRDGIEMHLATNYVGHYLLTALVIDRLASAERPQVVTLTSSLYRFGRLRLDDLAFERPYHLVSGYAQSKLAGVLFTQELARRTRALGLLGRCVDPGFVRSAIHRGTVGHQRWLTQRAERFGTDARETGRLIDQLTKDPGDLDGAEQYWTSRGPRRLARRARDQEAAAALWQRSLQWLSPDERRRLEAVASPRLAST